MLLNVMFTNAINLKMKLFQACFNLAQSLLEIRDISMDFIKGLPHLARKDFIC